jgi:hypothetical protein
MLCVSRIGRGTVVNHFKHYGMVGVFDLDHPGWFPCHPKASSKEAEAPG